MSSLCCCFGPNRPVGKITVQANPATPLLKKNPGIVSAYNASVIRNPLVMSSQEQVDSALRTGDEDRLHTILGTDRRLTPFTAILSGDAEGHLFARLIQAKKEDLIEEQIVLLIKLSNLFLDRKDYLRGAKLLNGALALLEAHQKNPTFQQHLFKRLGQIEDLFLQSRGVNVAPRRKKANHTLRLRLKRLRQEAQSKYEHKESISVIQTHLTEGFKALLKTLILDAQVVLGPPPVKWACIGMGSMARNEMCLYSDIEYAFLIENDTSTALEYFRLLAAFLELQIINLGETPFPLFVQVAPSHPSLLPRGFSVDAGGNTPLGVMGGYELIGTPEQLTQFGNKEWIDQNIILANAMSCICFVAGENPLALKYTQVLRASQDTRELLAKKLIEGHLREFRPELSER